MVDLDASLIFWVDGATGPRESWMEDIRTVARRAVIVVVRALLPAVWALPGLAPGVAGQEPEGLARTALDDSTFTWITRRTPGFRTHFQEGSYAAAHQDSLMARLVDAKAHDLTLLGEKAFDATMSVFFLEGRPEMERLLGFTATGFAEMRTASVFLVTNPEWRAFERHEVMHVLATRLWGAPAEPGAWIQEGLADGAGYVPIDTLITRFRELNDLTAYIQAASFVGYLYRTYGREVVRDIWRQGLEPASVAPTRTPAELVNEWKRSLPPATETPPLERIAAIRSHGCG